MSIGLFTPRAARELEEAAERIAEDRPDAAEAFLCAALQAAARIAARPKLGSVRPHVPPRYRFWPLTRYSCLLVYGTMAEPVTRWQGRSGFCGWSTCGGTCHAYWRICGSSARVDRAVST